MLWGMFSVRHILIIRIDKKYNKGAVIVTNKFLIFFSFFIMFIGNILGENYVISYIIQSFVSGIKLVNKS